MFYTDNENGIYDPVQVDFVKRLVCRNCPVLVDCLVSAKLENDNEYGLRAGMTPRERQIFWLDYELNPVKHSGPLYEELKVSLQEQR